MRRRTLLATPALLTLARGAAAQGGAGSYPDRPIRLVVPYPPGGGTDNLGRMIARLLGEKLGQTVVVENRGGAGGNIGATVVAQAPADGYTLLINGNGMAIADLLFSNPGFDWKRDFAYVARSASTPMLLVVNERVPVGTLTEFLAYARARKGQLNHGTPGAGTSQHLAAALLDEMAGTQIVHVPYRGTGPSVAGLLGNEVQVMFASSTAVDGLIRDGKVRAIANTAARRARGWPNLPAVAEAVPGYAAELWYPIAAPARTPPAIVAKLATAVREVMADPDFVAAITQRGFDPEYLDSAGVVQALEEDRNRWAPVLRRANITAE